MRKTSIVMASLLVMVTRTSQAQDQPQPQPGAWMPAGAVQAGTLTSELLGKDTMVAAMGAAGVGGCKNAADVEGVAPFISKQMEGAPGVRRWSEIWVFKCSSASPEVRIDFNETGDGGADYSIKMQ